jgi:hypothetical protein
MMVLVEALIATIVVILARYQHRKTRGGRKRGEKRK